MLSNGEDIIAEIPLEHLEIYRDYKRIGIIITLGGKCECCLKGVQHIVVLKYKGGYKGVRFALYTEDWVELTIDHIIPKFQGGKNTLKNYQVLCLFCNRAKGSLPMTIDELRLKIMNITKGISNGRL